MRRALGLQSDASVEPVGSHPTTPTIATHRPPRRFVRDGEVPVTLVHRDHRPDGAPATNQLEAARQAFRSETAARERAERLLGEAQATIRDLQTKFAHEHLARDEAIQVVQRAEADKLTVQQTLQTVQAELAAERLARRDAEDALAEALEAGEKAKRRLQEITAARASEGLPKPSVKRRASVEPLGAASDAAARGETDMHPDQNEEAFPTVPGTARKPGKRVVAIGGKMVKKTAQRRRPAKVTEQEPVEWWVKGWEKKWR